MSGPSSAEANKPSLSKISDSLKSGLDGIMLNTMLNSAGMAGTPTKTKEPLSIQIMTANFKKFIQKAGPLFQAQDAIESVLCWEDVPKTTFFAVVWLLLCLRPHLCIVVPHVTLVATLLYNRFTRQDTNTEVPPEEGEKAVRSGSLSGLPPAEGSVDYFSNMQHIQGIMGLTSDLCDIIRACVPYVAWHDERVSTVLLQFSVISGIGLLLVSPYIAWRYLFIFVGETAILSCHPVVRALARELQPFVSGLLKRAMKRISRILEEDTLSDSEIRAGGVVEIERTDVQSAVIEDTLEGQQITSWTSADPEGGVLPPGFRWLSPQWTVDDIGIWADGKIDTEGYSYIYLNGSFEASPIPVKIPTNPDSESESTPLLPILRKRRLTRLAVKLAV